MSKSKKPAEDKSKAGAVTNSIANEVEQILDLMWRKTSCWKPDINELAKTALLTLIANRERKARLAELLNVPFNDGRWSYKDIEEHWEARIAELQAEDKES